VNASDWPSSRPASRTQKWCGDITEISTDEGKHYLATVLDLFFAQLLACPTSTHPDAELACDAIKIATTVRGGRAPVNGVVCPHRPRINLHRKAFHRPVQASRSRRHSSADCGHPTTTRRPPQKAGRGMIPLI